MRLSVQRLRHFHVAIFYFKSFLRLSFDVCWFSMNMIDLIIWLAGSRILLLDFPRMTCFQTSTFLKWWLMFLSDYFYSLPRRLCHSPFAFHKMKNSRQFLSLPRISGLRILFSFLYKVCIFLDESDVPVILPLTKYYQIHN